jgi:hypothetical protein
MSDTSLQNALSVLNQFRYGEVSSFTALHPAPASDPTLGPLVDFVGTFSGNGFNTIFRPNNAVTPTQLPTPINPPADNVLELNLTSETLSFSKALGSVPNRGEVQGDIFLNGVPYLQTINDITVPTQPTGIHFEPGLWIAVPTTQVPAEGPTVVRMASIPHGTTIEAQGHFSTTAGAPTIPPTSITPFPIGNPGGLIVFPSQTAANSDTSRIPQNLSPFITAGTITQAILDDPNTLLRNHLTGQNIISTTTIVINTIATPLAGGGTDNIAFLLGDTTINPTRPNGAAVQMEAVFWIETVEHVITVPPYKPTFPPLTVAAPTGGAGQPIPRFQVHPPTPIAEPVQLTVQTTQIQYSQKVFLNFNGLTWPHVSVATLVPTDPVPVPTSAWT